MRIRTKKKIRPSEHVIDLSITPEPKEEYFTGNRKMVDGLQARGSFKGSIKKMLKSSKNKNNKTRRVRTWLAQKLAA